MADALLNNNSAYTTIRAAYAQALGDHAVDTVDLSDFCQNGVAYDTLIADNAYKDQFFKALLAQHVKNFFLDSDYSEIYEDPFYEDAEKFGAIVQMVSAQAPAVQESHAWREFVSGTSTAGEYVIFIPEVSSAYIGKSTSWELPFAISDEQANTAFKNEAELSQFNAFIQLVVKNAITQHLEDCNRLNVAHFMAEKIHYAGSMGATGVHKVDLRALYEAETGDSTITTAEAFMADDKCMRFAAEKLDEYSGYFRAQSELFNISGKTKFTPKSRQVLEVLQRFESRMKSVSYADAYNMDFVKLPGHLTVPYWQGFGTNTGAIDFDNVSTIKVKTASGDTVTQSGIVAFLADKWAIMHTIQSRRTAVTRFDPEAVTQYYIQHKDQRWNNLEMPAIVFTVEDKPENESKKK